MTLTDRQYRARRAELETENAGSPNLPFMLRLLDIDRAADDPMATAFARMAAICDHYQVGMSEVTAALQRMTTERESSGLTPR